MLRRFEFVPMLAAGILISAACLSAAADDPFVGTWKMNPDKSKIAEPPKSETVTIEADGKTTVNTVNSDGSTTTMSFAPVLGKEVQVTGGGDTTAVIETRPNARTVEHVWKGKSTMHGKGVVSKDGKSMTYTITGTNAKGEPVKDVWVYEKE